MKYWLYLLSENMKWSKWNKITETSRNSETLGFYVILQMYRSRSRKTYGRGWETRVQHSEVWPRVSLFLTLVSRLIRFHSPFLFPEILRIRRKKSELRLFQSSTFFLTISTFFLEFWEKQSEFWILLEIWLFSELRSPIFFVRSKKTQNCHNPLP